ncbi:hypothetical protein DFR76_110277 [Nocardia pseudobrasiliensis]|uniref:Ribbon-helix-helix CopG family protein n=2 Tax=Nocardia pseudobrasiliensis TaxID=45979 RepID=A0A370HZ22_9NOCA|nr:hypothetical protein [Nocardia pseudobrasiliensis]RDI63580.1 hypothetical protein DFR76_110277 [Nocardia pseudobrasiliensis]
MGEKDFPSTPEETSAFLDRLTFRDDPVPAAQLPPRLSPGEDIMVTTSIRLPMQLHGRIKELAEQRGIGVSTLVREWAEAAVADLDDHGELISRADALRALARIHTVRHAS